MTESIEIAFEQATELATELDHLQTLLLRYQSPQGPRCTSCGRKIEDRDRPFCPYCRGQMATIAYRIQVRAGQLYTTALSIAANPEGASDGTSEH